MFDKTACRPVVAGMVLMGALACRSATGPEFGVDPGLDDELVLRVGQTVAVDGANGLRLTFVEVTGDSRCPSHELILCIWEGDAVATVRAVQHPLPPATLPLHTNTRFETVATYGGFNVTLVRLDPYPETSDAIPPEDYRLTLDVRSRETPNASRRRPDAETRSGGE